MPAVSGIRPRCRRLLLQACLSFPSFSLPYLCLAHPVLPQTSGAPWDPLRLGSALAVQSPSTLPPPPSAGIPLNTCRVTRPFFVPSTARPMYDVHIHIQQPFPWLGARRLSQRESTNLPLCNIAHTTRWAAGHDDSLRSHLFWPFTGAPNAAKCDRLLVLRTREHRVRLALMETRHDESHDHATTPVHPFYLLKWRRK